MKTPAQRQFETQRQRENDRLDEIKADIIALIIIVVLLFCAIF